MEKLKLKNRRLEEENSRLKLKLIEMGTFSKRMVEITAEMDELLNQKTKEIEKLKQEIKSAVSVNVNSLCSDSRSKVKGSNIDMGGSVLKAEITPPNYDANVDDNEIADFTMELDEFVPELTQVKEEAVQYEYRNCRINEVHC